MHESSKGEVSTLKKENCALEQKIIKLKQQVISLEGKLEISSSRYKQLLEHIGSLGIGTPMDPFNEMLKMAHKANRQIPLYCKEDYNDGVYYWLKNDWTKEYLGGCGVLTVKHLDGAGSASYLVDEDGFVASETMQQKMRETLHTLCFTSLRFGCAPTSWTKIDIMALEFVRLSMRKAFIHFHLCDSDWKMDQFAIRHYLQWTHRPKEQGDPVMQEKTIIKRESTDEMLRAASAKPKWPQSITVSPSIRHQKKKKEDHTIKIVTPVTVVNTIERAARAKHTTSSVPMRVVETPGNDNNGPPLQSIFTSTAIHAVKIVNPLTGLFKTKLETPSDITSAVTPPATTFSSTNDLIAHMVTASMNNINNAVVPPTIEAKQSFIQLLSNSILATKDASTTCTNTSAVVAIATGSFAAADLDIDSTKATKKRKDPNTAKEANSRATAKSLCAIDWVASNIGSTNAAFENYWRKLDKEDKKKYQDRVALVKTAKACAVTLPNVDIDVVGTSDEILTSS
ncbi:uncharacterized protein EDB91DRAFT_1246918 [Suillus paluster]|uniref:uncharacterized protein n=1 Tax=Suillus paluster TaxID=48578 RepID=UPI001B879F9B|nr:uncharacterized protein EDB91DRAFT_1246918 [Suillus paluster]KAG1744033.1 hypothetical protein EDB91DRAFT_1246918 [Suillus paluster]